MLGLLAVILLVIIVDVCRVSIRSYRSREQSRREGAPSSQSDITPVLLVRYLDQRIGVAISASAIVGAAVAWLALEQLGISCHGQLVVEEQTAVCHEQEAVRAHASSRLSIKSECPDPGWWGPTVCALKQSDLSGLFSRDVLQRRACYSHGIGERRTRPATWQTQIAITPR